MAMGITERLDTPEEEKRASAFNNAAQMRVAIPGIIESFDPEKQTASVQPALTENIQIGESDARPEKLPLLTDVPVYFPRAGGYCITLPVTKDDECLLIFSDMCIDGWWQSGGVQDQMETRRHDLSDAVAIVGITSQPRRIVGYSPDKLQIRTDSGNVALEINQGGISIVGNLTVTGTITSGGINLNTHRHSYSWTDDGGNGNTSGPQ